MNTLLNWEMCCCWSFEIQFFNLFFFYFVLFSLQLSELEQRVIEAEERAEEAEDKVNCIHFCKEFYWICFPFRIRTKSIFQAVHFFFFWFILSYPKGCYNIEGLNISNFEKCFCQNNLHDKCQLFVPYHMSLYWIGIVNWFFSNINIIKLAKNTKIKCEWNILAQLCMCVCQVVEKNRNPWLQIRICLVGAVAKYSAILKNFFYFSFDSNNTEICKFIDWFKCVI